MWRSSEETRGEKERVEGEEEEEEVCVCGGRTGKMSER